MVRLSLRTTRVAGSGGRRGKIFYFSPQSRKRMLETTARLDWGKAGFVCFVTLGYPDRNGPPSFAEIERDRQVFFKRINRIHPGSAAIWRREYEPRKSGKFIGVPFPHYHMLFFGLPFLRYDVLNTMWCEVIAYEEYVRTEIKGVRSWKQALYYVSKYMAKPEFGPPLGAGDVRRQADAPPEGEGRSLVYVTYLTALEELKKARADKSIVGEEWEAIKAKYRDAAHRYRLERLKKGRRPQLERTQEIEESGKPEVSEAPSIGRSWGIFNRDKLPWAKRKVWRCRAGVWLEVAKHWARQKWAGIDESDNTGFTLFLEDAYKAFEELCSLRKPQP